MSNAAVTQGSDPVRTVHVARCQLRVGPQRWSFATARAGEIAQHWQRSLADNPAYFDGKVMLLGDWEISTDRLCGSYLRSSFAAYLYWRQHGYCDQSVRDGFGACILRSREGHFLLGRAMAGTMNAGYSYFVSGFLDAADIRADQTVDIDHAVARELGEETGLDAAMLQRQPGYLIAMTGSHVSIGVELASDLSSLELRDLILANMARQTKPELADIVVVRSIADLDPGTMPSFAIATMRHLWAQAG